MKITEQRLATLQKEFPVGTRIELLSMSDSYDPIPPNTFGTVNYLDSLGTLHCTFDNGRCLGMIYGEDSFRKIPQQEQGASKLFAEVTRKLSKLGLTSQNISDNHLSVFMDGERLCEVTTAGDVIYKEDFAFGEARKNMLDTINTETVTIQEYLTAMKSAPSLTAEGLGDGHKLLCEFNGVVLAGKERDNFGLEFVTWERDGGKGLISGHYFEDNYFEAKEDFAKRAGLVPSFKLWNTEQIGEIYKAIRYALENDSGMSVQQEQTLAHIKEHIEYENIDIDELKHQEKDTINMSMI